LKPLLSAMLLLVEKFKKAPPFLFFWYNESDFY
jgi:hypothetical protein